MPKCKSCNIPYIDHMGLEGTCKLYREALELIDDLEKVIERLNKLIKE